ncbi:hypothetical protein LIER_12168 [Lithospermum erythrorhizon]|uniref:Uncharacterized protein n=1 Tax=Lithospermum erythrorhizon TaxID=34254 RepID=A0AAV3PQN5_LITER
MACRYYSCLLLCISFLIQSLSILEASRIVNEELLKKYQPSSPNQSYRTSYHFQPPKNWMNDPNGELLMLNFGMQLHWHHQKVARTPRRGVQMNILTLLYSIMKTHKTFGELVDRYFIICWRHGSADTIHISIEKLFISF